jgi:lambda family phage portal protein
MAWADSLPTIKKQAKRKSSVASPSGSSTVLTKSDGPQRLRRWEGAKTNRLNRDHWNSVGGWHSRSINDDIYSDLDTLVARCTYEANNNPMVEGVIETHAGDIAGKNGPTLQVISDDQAYNDAVEESWQEFFDMPDARGQIDGVQAIMLWVSQLWTKGRFINQFVTTNRQGSFDLALRFVDPMRLRTPYGTTEADIAMGIELDANGKATHYHIQEPRRFGNSASAYGKFDRLPADVIQHRFLMKEADQLTGVPLLASALPVIAELRDFDSEVMEAARAAASQAVFWYTDHPEAIPVEVDDVLEIERGTQSTGPYGYRPAMLNPTQPSTTYIDFRHERLRELGRVANMPLMTILLSSRDQNFASAHYDGLVYRRSLERLQGWCGRRTLSPLVDAVALETRLARGMVKPRKVSYEWSWPVPPFADPKKAYETLRMMLEDGTITYPEVLRVLGYSYEQVVKERVKVSAELVEAGLPPLPINLGRVGGDASSNGKPSSDPPASDDGDDSESNEETADDGEEINA